MSNGKFKVSFSVTEGNKVVYAQKAGEIEPRVANYELVKKELGAPIITNKAPVQEQPQPVPIVTVQNPVSLNYNQPSDSSMEPNNVIYRSRPGSPVKFTVTQGAPVYSKNNRQPQQQQRPKQQSTALKVPQAYDPRKYPVCVYKHPQINFNRPIKEELYPVLSLMLDMIDDFYGRGATIEVSRKLGLYYVDKDSAKMQQQGVKQQHVVQQAKQQTQTPEPNRTQQQTQNNSTSTQPVQRPTSGLYVQQPKTAEEIEAEEMSTRVENTAMGFPGEPVVETMRFKQQAPLLKQRVIDRLNNFNADPTNEVLNFNYLKENTEALIKEDVARLMNTDLNGFEANVSATVDHRNIKCYDISVTNYANPIFVIRLYPAQSEADKNSERMQQRQIAPGINPIESQIQPVQEPEEIEQEFKTTSLGDFLWDRALFHKQEIFKMFEKDMDRKLIIYGELMGDLTKLAGINKKKAESFAAQYIQLAFPFEEKPTVDSDIAIPIDNEQQVIDATETSSINPVIEL